VDIRLSYHGRLEDRASRSWNGVLWRMIVDPDARHSGVFKKGTLCSRCYLKYRLTRHFDSSSKKWATSGLQVVCKMLLLLNQRAIKNRPGIKACLIGSPEAPSVFILFFDWQVKQ
jgi:hypothetical protein